MTAYQSDVILLLRLAGTRSGVCERYIPAAVIALAADLGSQVSFLRGRLFVRNAASILQRLKDLTT